MDNPQYRLELAKESMDISLTLLAIRLGLKKVSIEERYLLKIRAERLHRLTGELK
jgi:hypothetical protein